MSKKYNAIGAYIYAGGFTLGMREYFNVMAHFEDGDFGVATVRKNMTDLPVYTIPDDWPLDEYRDRCDVCYANPPCAPWSTAGARAEVGAERTEDHRRLMQLMEGLDPTIWVWESVTQAYRGDHTELSQYITGHAMELGYNVYHFLHDVKTMGLPQQRRRVLTVASKVLIDWPIPNYPRKTVAMALDGLEDPGEIPSFTEKWSEYLPTLDQGETLRNRVLADPDHEGAAPGFLLHRTRLNQASRTLLGGVHVIHPTEDRFIGTKEAAALCGYPRDYEFVGAPVSQFQQIARAVTPSLGRYLGQTLVDALDRNEVPVEPGEYEVDYLCRSPRIEDYRIKGEIRRLA